MAPHVGLWIKICWRGLTAGLVVLSYYPDECENIILAAFVLSKNKLFPLSSASITCLPFSLEVHGRQMDLPEFALGTCLVTED
jgi:hypothetical protein